MSNNNAQPKRLSRKAQLLASAGIILFALLASFYFGNQEPPTSLQSTAGQERAMTGTYYADIAIQDYGTVTVELNGDAAPITVGNFVTLAREGFYDGLTFHRVMDGFMMQGGDPNGNGTGGPGYCIPGEFAMNGFKNDLKHSRGVLSMARAMNPNSAGSQFFIMVSTATHLDGQYAAFGKVIEGLEACDDIVMQKRSFVNDCPLNPIVMKQVTVETFGEDLGEPEMC